jgi:hypothetical protein
MPNQEPDSKPETVEQSSGEGLSSSVLLCRLSEITQELCADYPNIATVEPWEQLYALEQSHRGVSAACDDLHKVIETLRVRCGLTKEEVVDLGWPNNPVRTSKQL